LASVIHCNMKIDLNRSVAYTASWKKTLLISCILGAFVSFILIFLEPFDSRGFQTNYKLLKLSGYSVSIIAGILVLHVFENVWYRRVSSWKVYHEAAALLAGSILLTVFSFLHNFYIVNSLTGFNFNYLSGFLLYFGLPFIPIIVPLWIYLRFKFGKMKTVDTSRTSELLTITGDNKTESFSMSSSDFILARAQQNYVQIFFVEDGKIEQQLLRSTLSNIKDQIPNATQVHRSYLVNLDFVTEVEGNSRKRKLVLSRKVEPVPITQKYYESLENRLAISSQTL
jgi:hypothetical protein